MKRTLMAIGLALVIAPPAQSQVPFRFADWIAGPVQHLMTKDEVNRSRSIRSDDEATRFIDLFWARRDPTPQTPRNEFREEFEARVQAADHHFSTTRTRGAMSDRGRALILLGTPYQVGSRGPSTASPRARAIMPGQWDGSVPSPRAEPARMVWIYGYDNKPKFIRRKEVEIVFYDERGGGEWEFANTARTNPDQILQEAVNAYIVSPDLTEAAFATEAFSTILAPGTSFRNPALKSAYEQFRAEQKPPLGPVHLTWGEYVTPAGEHYVPVQLYVPASAGIPRTDELTFFGVIEDQAGAIIKIHEEPRVLSVSGADAFVDESLRLAPGSYTATFGLAADGKPLAMTSTNMSITGLDAAAAGASQLILANNVYRLDHTVDPDAPYTFGGLKVVPKGDSLFSPHDQLWYFVELRNPGLAEQGTPKVEIKIDIEGKTEQRKVRMAFPLQQAEVTKLQGGENRYAIGTAIPLETFPPGDYTMKIRITDSVLGKTYELEKAFLIGKS